MKFLSCCVCCLRLGSFRLAPSGMCLRESGNSRWKNHRSNINNRKQKLVYLSEGKALLAMSFVVRVVLDGQLPWKPNECVWQVMRRTLSLSQTQNKASSLFFMIWCGWDAGEDDAREKLTQLKWWTTVITMKFQHPHEAPHHTDFN